MTELKGVLLSLPVVAVALGALSVGLVYLGRYGGLGDASLLLLVIPIALAFLYIRWYRTLPYEPRGVPAGLGTASLLGAATDEPFEDPVEEADRFDRVAKAGPPPEEPTVSEDDPASESPPAP